MKKLITLLAIITLISCEKERMPINGEITVIVRNTIELGTSPLGFKVEYYSGDMLIKDDLSSIKIAIEIKKGDKGQAIREGIGQSIVYSEVIDFVSYLFVDTSDDKRILNSMELSRESKLAYSLWNNYNIWLGII